MRTKLRDWAVWRARAGCYCQAALSSNDSKTLYLSEGGLVGAWREAGVGGARHVVEDDGARPLQEDPGLLAPAQVQDAHHLRRDSQRCYSVPQWCENWVALTLFPRSCLGSR